MKVYQALQTYLIYKPNTNTHEIFRKDLQQGEIFFVLSEAPLSRGDYDDANKHIIYILGRDKKAKITINNGTLDTRAKAFKRLV